MAGSNIINIFKASSTHCLMAPLKSGSNLPSDWSCLQVCTKLGFWLGASKYKEKIRTAMDWSGDIKRQSKKKRINWAGQKEICSQSYLYSSRNRYITPHTPHPSRPLLQKAWMYVKQFRKSFFQSHHKSKCPSGGCIAWWRGRRGIPSLMAQLVCKPHRNTESDAFSGLRVPICN